MKSDSPEQGQEAVACLDVKSDSPEQGQEAVASLDVKSECPEKGQDVVASFDGLAECITALKPFANETVLVLEKCQKRLGREMTSFTELRAKLQDVCQSCDQKDRLILAGSGNVGKSTIANAFLGGGKFWPTARFCMTSRICEAHYDAASDGTSIDKEMVQENTSSEPLQVWHPSPLLKPDVILVDLPGLDQKEEYMERLVKYMNSHSASSVVLLYVIDVKNKICNPDRQFLEKLMKSPWQNLSQGLGFLVNKCDVGGDTNVANSDEEVPDYPKLIADITKETQNYCTPTVMDLSMKNKKENNPAAIQKWQKVEAYAHNALTKLKGKRLIQILLSLERIMDMLRLAVQDDEHLRGEIEKREKHLLLAEDKVKQVTDDKDEWVRRRAEEIKQTLKERQEGHLDAILQASVPHYNCRVAEAFGLREVDTVIHDRIQVMVANDIQLSAGTSLPIADAVAGISAVTGLIYAVGFVVAAAATDGVVGLLAATIMFPVTVMAGGVAGMVVVLPFAIIGAVIPMTLVDKSYVRDRFTKIYKKVMKEYPDKCAKHEHDSIVGQTKTVLQAQRESLQHLQKEAGTRGFLDDEFKAECSELQEKYGSLTKRCNTMLDLFLKWAKSVRMQVKGGDI